MKMRLCLAVAMMSIAVLPARAQDRNYIRISGEDNPALRILQSYTLKPDETARGVLVIANDALIEGHVEGDVLVVLGQAQLAGTAVVDGSFVIVGGTGTIADGAQVHGDVFAIGGLDMPPAFNPGGSQVVIGTPVIGRQLRGIVPWLTRGLALGRLIVPDLGWVWTVAAVFFLINLLLNVLFDAPVRASAAALHEGPFSAFLTGLLVMLLAGPLCALLAVSVVGIVVIPFFIGALMLGGIIGRVGFARWLGMSIVRQADAASRAQSLRSFLIGSAVMCIAYVIPVLGLLMWGMAAVFGLGGATQAFARAYRRENPRRARKAAVTGDRVPAVAATVPLVAPGGALQAEPVETVAETPAAPAAATPIPEPPPIGGLLAYPRAAFLERLAAFVLDFVLVAIVAQVLRLDRLVGSYDVSDNVLLVGLVYHIGFWTWQQTTVGGIICQLRLVRADGGPVRFAEALVRGLSGIFSLVVAGLGFLWIIWDPEKQAWHDRIAGTYVVKVPRHWSA